MQQEQLRSRLQDGLFISSMMHMTDGAYVTERAQGACMVQIGALIVDPLDHTHDPRSLLPGDYRFMVSALRREMEVIREGWDDLPVALNAAPGDHDSAVRMAQAFSESGGDIFELNCHGGYKKLLDRGLLQAMVVTENRASMIAWLKDLCELNTAIVVKFNSLTPNVDFQEVLQDVASVKNLFGIHFNVRSQDGSEPNLEFVRMARKLVSGMLFCSGHVKSREQVDALVEAGADCVGIAQGVIDDPQIISRLAKESADA